MGDIVLNPEDIETHYNALYSSSNATIPENIIVDTSTVLKIKDVIDETKAYDLELENMVRTCIQADAQNLSNLGATFIQKDMDVSIQIEEMLS